MRSNSKQIVNKQSIFPIFSWLFKTTTKNYLVLVYIFIFSPILSYLLFNLFQASSQITNTQDPYLFSYISFTHFSIGCIFNVVPLSLVVLPLLVNSARHNTIINKIKIWNQQIAFVIATIVLFLLMNLISTIWNTLIMIVTNLAVFRYTMNSFLLIHINYGGFVVGLLLAIFFFSCFALFLSFLNRSMFTIAIIGALLLIFYIADSGYAINFYQLRPTPGLYIATYFSPFSYINIIMQMSMIDVSIDSPSGMNGGIFDANHNFYISRIGLVVFYTYDIWLAWSFSLLIPIVSGATTFIKIKKQKNLWISN